MIEGSVGKVRKKLPIGIENFEEFSSENFYYADKTLFSKSVYSAPTVWKVPQHEHAEMLF